MFNFVIIAVVLFVFLYWISVRRSHVNKKVYGSSATAFSDAIQPLLQNEDTPVAVLDFVAFMNNTIQDQKAARLILGVFRTKSDIGEKPDEIKEMDAFFEQRPELLEPFRVASFSYITAVTFNGCGIAGYLSRAFLKNMFRRHQEMANAVAQDVYYYEKTKHGGTIGGAVPIRSC